MLPWGNIMKELNYHKELMMSDYFQATDEVLTLLDEIKVEYHPELKPFSLAVVMFDGVKKKHGRSIYTVQSIPPGRYLPVMKDNYGAMIEISLEKWKSSTDKEKRLALDNALQGITVDKDTHSLKLRAYDIQLHSVIAHRWGLELPDVAKAASAMQLPLMDTDVNIPSFSPDVANGQLVRKGDEWVIQDDDDDDDETPEAPPAPNLDPEFGDMPSAAEIAEADQKQAARDDAALKKAKEKAKEM